MTDINSVVLVGRLCRDLEIRFTNNNMAIGNFAIAINRSVKKGEKWEDETSFFDCTVFGKTAENLQNYLKKGKQVAINGYLKQDRWEKDGKKQSRVTVICDNIQLVVGKDTTTNNQEKPADNNAAPEMEYGEDVSF